jgi:hypothetical protein
MPLSRRTFLLLASTSIASTMARAQTTGPIIPSNRLAPWQPGVTYNGGIPSRTTIFKTLSPMGGGANDTAQIQAAINAAGAIATAANPQVVLLNAGVYNINGNGLSLSSSYVTLRGSGIPAAMATGGNLANDASSALGYVSGTWLQKADRQTNSNYGVLYLGRVPNWTAIKSSTNLTADATQGSFSCTVASASGLSVGQLVLMDHVTDSDPNVFYGNRNDLSGYFTGSLSGTSLTFSAPINGPTGVNGSFSGTFSGTSLKVNSAAVTGYVPQLGPSTNPVGVTIFDASNNYYGYITGGSYPNFTMSQSNGSATLNLQIGGIIPAVGYPIFDGVFSTSYGFITGGSFPNFTMGQSNPTLNNVTLTAGGGSRRFFGRQDRSVSQLMQITNINGNTITFGTPFYYTFLTQYAAQLSTFDPVNYPIKTGISVENLGIFGGMGGDGNGNLAMGCCTNSWVKNVESYWSVGTGIGLYGCYRCEVRDSFMHETPSPNPGGGGYLSGLNTWSSDCLFENCIMWMGNKEVVMRGAGGANVLGYNYMDDAFGGTYPESPEAGANAAHYATTVFALIEGNYSQNFEGDAFWGNSFCITAHRNWFSGIRGCSPTGSAPNIAPCNNLRNYKSVQGSVTYPYGDYLGRRMVDVQAASYNHNFTGNVLGFTGQTLLSYNGGGFTTAQTTWVYEELDSVIANGQNVILWNIGTMQNPSGGFQWVGNTYTTQLRSGNWDWYTQSQQWHGIGGSNKYGGNLAPPYPSIPNSYYITGRPAFFNPSTIQYPWVNPATGATYVLPAKARFDAGTPNAVPRGQGLTAIHDLNRDRLGNFLWRDSRDMAGWLMNSGALMSAAVLGNVLTDRSDFNSDGISDVLRRDNLGNIGTTVASRVSVGNIVTSWPAVAVEDFDGDDVTAIVWRDTAGARAPSAEQRTSPTMP